ncbi:hypothetical protein HanXRQr2_Chr13g0606091 [Helianthus annuus]|uniref:Uncharacterized protein n=1 Tax=Helianthus annuus TaxID=4232 RepID=A0A9K3HC30_HELAN|nr:hypothetical protein HanXRQr2_Chr13g0606091 [Helianthus annuus]
MMRKKALEDKKHKLDERAAALLALKKAKLHKEAPPAPSESDIDMGIFSGGRGNLLEEIFAASALLGSSQAKGLIGLIFHRSLPLLLRRLGRLTYPLLAMILGKRRRMMK